MLVRAVVLAAYTVVGKDRRVLPMLQDAVDSIAADLKAPRRQPPEPPPRPLLRLTDLDWH